jgi:exodeoxyribonuclease VII large subunit
VKQVGTRRVWTVAEISGAISRRFEDVPSCWVEAEVTNLGRRGGQVYFTLVDHGPDPHLVEASMQANVFDRLESRPENGTLVHAYGRVEFWAKRSQVRLRVARIELTGRGLLLARIDELKRKLAAEGLTADSRKRPLPLLPRRIGLVTSGDGAARADFLKNVHQRFPAAGVLVVRSLVQGASAPAEIVKAIHYLDACDDVDVIVLARGGGALEDLMAFNAESVCRAVAASTTPIVSAVGHETDITVCDLVADVRVSTPTKAAEAVVPDAAELEAALARRSVTLARSLSDLTRAGHRSAGDLAARLGRALHGRGALAAVQSDTLARRLGPALRAAERHAAGSVAGSAANLDRAIASSVATAASNVARLAALHELLSPARTVARGYAIVRDAAAGKVVADAAVVGPGDDLQVEFRDGRVGVTVTTGGHG